VAQAKGKRGRRLLLLAILLVGAMAVVGFFVNIFYFAEQPLVSDGPREVIVEPGEGFNAVLAKLRRAGITEGSDLQWRVLGKISNTAGRIQVGEYEIAPNATPQRVLQQLSNGEVVQRKFTIVEGRNFRELRAELQANTQLEHEIGTMSDAELMATLGRRGVPPEGRFLPETYVFTRGTSDLQILARAMQAMDEELAEAWQDRRADVKLKSPNELLVLASIVEKETGLAVERPQIAGVFLRRLERGMLLQTDPTVIYGMGTAYDGNIRKADLERDTPWNTYRRAGLPPTPIAMPGKASLLAVAHPAGGKSLYFVASGGGGHVFNDSLEAHNAAVRKYQLKRR
jgi:UPF0755 protein